MKTLHGFDERTLLVAAFRYYCGRMTISSSCFAQGLARRWEHIEKGTREIIGSELEGEFRLDDESRASGQQHHPLGHQCDRDAWAMVREKYKQEVKP